MNRPLCALLTLLLVTGLAWTTAVAQAPPVISQTIKQNPNPDETQRKAVADFVQGHVQKLLDSQDPKAQADARNTLVKQTSLSGVVGGDEPSPAYLDIYASAVNNALKQVPSEADLRTQLNAAIVAAMVAEKANNSQLRDAALNALKSDNDAIALWGLKAARAVLPWAMRINDTALLDAIVPAVKDHASGAAAGPIASAGYDALSLNYVSNPRPGAQPGMLSQVVPHLQKLLEIRIDQYLSGLPQQPSAETQATTFLTFGEVWGAQDAEQQMRTIQLLTDLVTVASQQAGKASAGDRAQLAPVISRAAAAIAVVPAVAKAEKARATLSTIASVTPQTPQSDFILYSQSVRPAVAEVPEFSALKPAPEPQPATQVAPEEKVNPPPAGDEVAPASEEGAVEGSVEAGEVLEGAADNAPADEDAQTPAERENSDMARLLLIPLALLILLAGAMAWSGAGTEERADFTFINRGEIGTLDPNRMSWLQDIRMGYALWEGLYTLDAQTLEPILGSAGQVDISDDKTVYTFHIRPEARWTNGDPLLAKDFVFAWRRMLEQPGDYTYLFDYIRGAYAYGEAFAAEQNSEAAVGRLPDFQSVGIEILGEKSLRVTLNHPVTFFPDLCAFPPFFPLHEPSMRQFGQKGADGRVRYSADFTRPPNLVTNGPYRLDSWAFKRRIRMVASDFYWDRANVKSRMIDMLGFEDTQTAFLKYESGGVDWLAEVASETAAELLAQGGREDFHLFPGFGTYFYSINCQPKLADGQPNPFADVRVRRAMSMAIDKEPIVKTIMRMGQPVATTYIPPDAFKEYHSPKGIGYDPAAAKQLLADAGFPGGKGFPKLTLLYNNEGDHKYIAQNIRGQWAKNLGIDIGVEGVEIKTFRKRLHDKKYDVARASWIGDYNDPSTFTDKYLSTSENNDCAWKNPEYDRLCAAAVVEPDAEKRLRMLERAEAILIDEAPIIPIYHYVNAYMFPSSVRGVPLNPRNMTIFKALEVRR